MTASTVSLDDAPLLLELFLTGYWSQRTRGNYAFILGAWFAWCAGDGHDPLRDADPRVVERWITDMQQRPYAANTTAARLLEACESRDTWKPGTTVGSTFTAHAGVRLAACATDGLCRWVGQRW